MTPIARQLGPVPPLDDAARARLERAVLADLARPAPAPAPRWRWAIATGAALAAAAALVFILLRPAPSPTRFTATDAPREVSFGDASITLEPGSEISAAGDADRGATITLARGAATFEVAPRANRPPFRVEHAGVTVEVVGTRFRVEAHDDATTVDVTEGTVRVRAAGRTSVLHAGDHWPTRIAAVEPPPPLPPPVVEEPAPAITSKPAPPPPAPARKRTPAVEAADQFEKAARLEASDAPAAITEYRKLARRSDSWGATALFAIARLEAARGDQAAAEKDLRAYLKRFPDGRNAEDARVLLDRLGR